MQVLPDFMERYDFSYATVAGERIYYLSSERSLEFQRDPGALDVATLEESVQTGDGIYNRVVFSREMSCNARTQRLGIGILFGTLCCIPTLGTLCCWNGCEFPKENFIAPLCGNEGFMAYVKDDEATRALEEADYSRLGFRPLDTESLHAYIGKNRHNVETIPALSHQYLLFPRQSGISSYIFIPYGEVQDAMVRTTWNNQGDPLGTSELVAHIVKQAATYNPKNRTGRSRISTNTTDPKRPLLERKTLYS